MRTEIFTIFEWEIREKLVVELSFPFFIDGVRCLLNTVVLYISGCVVLFAGFYMSHEKFLGRFIRIVILFVLSMVLLIISPRFFSLMIG